MHSDDPGPDGPRDWRYPDDFVVETITEQGHNVEHGDGPMTARAEETSAGLRFDMSGRPPRGEDGSHEVCIRLAQALQRSSGLPWAAEPLNPSERESGFDGFVLRADGQRMGVQVTRVGQQERWVEISQSGSSSGSATAEQAAADIWRAIERKLLAQDPTGILALHAGQPPYYGFTNVVLTFDRLYGAELRRRIGFAQVWLLGYTDSTTARLHPEDMAGR